MNPKKPLILIVDDDSMIVESLTDIIHDSGDYEFITAPDGLSALELMKRNRRWAGLAKHPVSCIILDIKMPEMDGLEFLREWRKSEIFDLIPVILLSAYEDEEKWAKATDVTQGMVAKYLKKPVKKNDLLDSLHRILVKREGEDMIDDTREASYDRVDKLRSK